MSRQIVINGPSDIKADNMNVDTFKRILSKGMLVRILCNRTGTSDAFRHQIQYTHIYIAIRDREDIVRVIRYYVQRPLANNIHAEAFVVKTFFDDPPQDSVGHSLQDAMDMMMEMTPDLRWALAQQNVAYIQLHSREGHEVAMSHPFVLMELDRLQKHVQDLVAFGWDRHHKKLDGLNTAHFNDYISALLREHMGNLASVTGL